MELGAVPETLLWTLYHRGTEARRPDAVLHDPKAVELLDAIDFPFEERFGSATAGWAQWQALRAAYFDREIRRFLATIPTARSLPSARGSRTSSGASTTAVSAGGASTSEAIALRRRLLPEPRRARLLACSATDERWLDEVDTSAAVLVSAQELLMYLRPDEVHALLATCASRIPAGALLFDAVSRRLSERSRGGRLGGGTGYTPPPWTWGIDAAERRWIRSLANVAELRTLCFPRGRGPLFGYVLPLFNTLPRLRHGLLSIMLARLGHE